eukprot:5448533-Pleurochrysis_carterae.AAC.1
MPPASGGVARRLGCTVVYYQQPLRVDRRQRATAVARTRLPLRVAAYCSLHCNLYCTLGPSPWLFCPFVAKRLGYLCYSSQYGYVRQMHAASRMYSVYHSSIYNDALAPAYAELSVNA